MVVDALRERVAQGAGLLLVTHDWTMVEALAHRVLVLRAGEVVEQGETRAVLERPQHAFTLDLIAAQPKHWPEFPTPTTGAELLRAERLSVAIGGKTLVQDLNWSIRAGERWALQGPSGCGKTTLGRVLHQCAAIGAALVVVTHEAALARAVAGDRCTAL